MKKIKLFAWWTLLAILLGSAVLLNGEVFAKKDSGLVKILDGWAEALGGREALGRPEALNFKYKITMAGMEGTGETWSTADGRHRFEMDLAGLFQMVTVWNGSEGWMRDQNGKVSRVAGDERMNEINSAYFATWSHLLPGRLAGDIEYLGTEEKTGAYILRIQPKGGREVTFFLDPVRYLPLRSERSASGRTITVSYEDWQTFGEILFSADTRQSRGDVGHEATFRLEEVQWDRTPPRTAFQKPDESADDVRFTSGSPARDIPIELSTHHIFLQARVNGSEPLWFVLDTGASVTVLNTSVAKQLGLKMKGSMQGGGAGEKTVEVRMIPGVSFQMPGVELKEQTVAAIPMDAVEPKIGRSIDGVLGYDFISRFVVVIDYQNSRMHLYDRKQFQYQGAGVSVPLRLVHNIPQVDVTVTPFGRDPINANFVVDSGAGLALAFTRPFADREKLISTLPKKYEYKGGAGVGGMSKVTVGRIAGLEISGIDFPEPVAMIFRDEKGAGASSSFDGLIGGEILARFTVYFDYERERMILEPNDSIADSFVADMSGLSFSTGGRGDWDTLTVHQVRPDSPAKKAGVEIGDVIRDIDGKPARQFTVNSLKEYFRREGKTVRLTLDRDGQMVETKIKLKPSV